MQYHEFRRPFWVDAAHSMINGYIVWSPDGAEQAFTANPDDPEPHGREIFARAVAGDFGAILPHEPVPPSIDDYSAAVQGMLDAKARERQYDSLLTAVGYVTSGNAAWAAEAVALRDWRDAVWAYALAQLALVTTGEREAPPVDAFVTEATAACPFEWPE